MKVTKVFVKLQKTRENCGFAMSVHNGNNNCCSIKIQGPDSITFESLAHALDRFVDQLRAYDKSNGDKT